MTKLRKNNSSNNSNNTYKTEYPILNGHTDDVKHENPTDDNETIDPLAESYSREIRPFIDAIDNLRRYGLQKDIDLPRVVVLGDQSSGKSSIIEAISGIELPRGKGIVTRCPLELQLTRVLNQKWSAALSYKDATGELQKIRTEEPSEVEELIRTAQEKMCTTNKGVSSELITLRIESPAKSAPDLTLIDLPGIARIAVDGQPYDICSQIRNILKAFIHNENTVILCVVSAHLDLAVNECIGMAKEFDPLGLRTFGVLTKPDMVVEDSLKEEVLAILNNERLPLMKGYHMVKCRSQKQLEDKLTLAHSLQMENEYFEDDDFYKTADKSRLGTKNLALKITKELVNNIKDTLPNLMEKIEEITISAEKKLARLPRGVPQSNPDKTVFLVETTSALNYTIKDAFVAGKSELCENSHFSTWRIFFETFKTKIDKRFSDAMSKKFSKENVEKQLESKRGCEIIGFLNFDLFQLFVKDHIQSYLEDAKELAGVMIKDTSKIITELVDAHFSNLKIVQFKLNKIIHDEIAYYGDMAKERVKLRFEEEKLIFTMDSIFNKELDYFNKIKLKEELKEQKRIEEQLARTSTKPVINATQIDMDEKTKAKRNLKDMDNADKLILIIQCYLKITNARLSDCIPMAIRQVLHVQLIESLKMKFFAYATKTESTEDLLEDNQVSNERTETEGKLDRLKKARMELLGIV